MSAHGTVRSPAGRAGRAVVNVAAGAALVYLFLPIFWIVVLSFNDPQGKFNYNWNRFTLDNWANPFAEPALQEALGNSLRVAFLAATVATILGALIAIALVRYRFRGNKLIDTFLVLPLTSPEIVLGASLLTLFLDRSVLLGNYQFTFGFETILIAHIMFCVSFVALTVRARIRGFDWTLEDAAMDLGSPPARTFLRITLPLIMPGILAAFLLSFALSLDDFIITLFARGSSDFATFPIQVFGQSRTSVPPQIHVLSTMILLVSVAILLAGSLVRRRQAAEAPGSEASADLTPPPVASALST